MDRLQRRRLRRMKKHLEDQIPHSSLRAPTPEQEREQAQFFLKDRKLNQMLDHMISLDNQVRSLRQLARKQTA